MLFGRRKPRPLPEASRMGFRSRLRRARLAPPRSRLRPLGRPLQCSAYRPALQSSLRRPSPSAWFRRHRRD